MSIPTAPTLLLAVGGVILILSRWKHSARSFEALWLAGMSGAIWILAETGRALPDQSDKLTYSVWANDSLGLMGQALALLLGILFGLGSFGGQSAFDRPGERFGFLSFQTAGLIMVAVARDCVTFALAIEVVQLASLALRKVDRLESPETGTNNENRSIDDCLGVAIVSSLCVWLGIALLCQMTGSTHHDQIRRVLLDAYQPGPNRVAIGAGSRLGLLAIGLIVAGLGGRMGLVPWHLVFVNAGRGVRHWTAGNVILSGQLAGLLGLTRLCGGVCVGYRDETIVLLMAPAALTFLLSGCLSLHGLAPGEGRVSQWLAGLSMLHGAWLAVGLMAAVADMHSSEQSLSASAGQPGALGLVLFSAAAALVGLSGLFLLFSSLSRSGRDLEFVDELQGRIRLSPAVALSLLTLSASLIGQPPLWGFWGQWLLTVAGLNVRAGSRDDAIPHAGMIVLLAVALMGTLMTAGLVLRLARVVLLEIPASQSPPTGRKSGFVVACVCAMTVVVVGISPAGLLTRLASVRGPNSPAATESPQGKGRGEATVDLEADRARP